MRINIWLQYFKAKKPICIKINWYTYNVLLIFESESVSVNILTDTWQSESRYRFRFSSGIRI